MNEGVDVNDLWTKGEELQGWLHITPEAMARDDWKLALHHEIETLEADLIRWAEDKKALLRSQP